MDDSKWERWGALGGIAFVVIIVITMGLTGSPPKTTDSATKIANYVSDKNDSLRWSAYLGTLAALPFFWWASSLWRRMSRSEGGQPRLAVLTLAGLVFGTALATVSSLLFSAVAIQGVAGSGGKEGTKFFYVLAWLFNGGALVGIAAAIAGASALSIRTGMFPKALGWFGALVAVLAVAGAASVASTRDAVFTLTFIAFAGSLLWVLIASVVMLRSAPASAPSSAS
jgi:hypothetical protein